jgi:hypothetical protein
MANLKIRILRISILIPFLASPVAVASCGPYYFPEPLFVLPRILEINHSEFEKVKSWVNSNDEANLFKFIAIKFNDPNLDISDKYIFYKPLEF